ncbi:unnamed protein product [Leuciscus chuanchicus]
MFCASESEKKHGRRLCRQATQAAAWGAICWTGSVVSAVLLSRQQIILKSGIEWEIMQDMDDNTFARHIRIRRARFEQLLQLLQEGGLHSEHSHGLPPPLACSQKGPHVSLRISGLDGVIGAIDGCHIRVQSPPIRGGDYINRKSYYSVLLQGIANDDGCDEHP